MTVLVRWLGLDMNGIFGNQKTSVSAGRSDQQEVLKLLNELNPTQLNLIKNLISVGFLSKKGSTIIHLNERLTGLVEIRESSVNF